MTVAGLANGRNFYLQNNLRNAVWVAILGKPGKGQPDGGGFVLPPGLRVSKGLESCGCGTWLPKEINYTEATERNTITLTLPKFIIQ
jgi:hypothetical protein